MVKAVFIDVDNTLLDFIPCSISAMRTCFEEFSLPFTDKTYPTFTSVNTPLWESLERGEIVREDIFRTRWNTIFAKLGLQADGLAFEKRFLALLSISAIPVEGAVELLSYLHKKFTVCIASNSMYEHQRGRLELAGMAPYIDHLFVSEQIGFDKPSKAFFDGCLAQLPSIRPEETIMIGDSLTADVAGGINSNIPTIWFNHDHIAVPHGCGATYIVNSLSEITAIL